MASVFKLTRHISDCVFRDLGGDVMGKQESRYLRLAVGIIVIFSYTIASRARGLRISVQESHILKDSPYAL